MSENHKTIAHIMPWPCVGGVELATLRLAEGIEGEEFKNVAFCLREARPVREMFERKGFRVVEYETTEPSYRHPKQYLRLSRRLAHALKEEKVDLMHSADLLAAHRSSLAGMLARVPQVCHVRGRFEEISRRDRSFLFPIRRFVFVSENTRRDFGHRVKQTRASVIYDGIEAKELSHDETRQSVCAEFSIPHDAKIIGMVARIAPAKDYPTLIRAAARLVEKHPDTRFLIVGEHSGVEAYREHFEEVKGWLREHGVAHNFIFTDFREDVARLTSAMDIFVLSTHMEGLPLVILEAMAQARPVVATNVGGIPEAVRHEETGLLFAHADDCELASHLASLLDDERLARRMGLAGYELVKSDFSRERFASNVKNLYREMLGLKESRVERVRGRALVGDV